jgi:hypothetical protein
MTLALTVPAFIAGWLACMHLRRWLERRRQYQEALERAHNAIERAHRRAQSEREIAQLERLLSLPAREPRR